MLGALPPRGMERGGDERYSGNRLCLGFRALRAQFRLRKSLGEVVQDRRHFGQRPGIDQEGRNLSLGVEGKEIRRAMVSPCE